MFPVPRPFRIKAKLLNGQFSLTVKGLITSPVSTQLWFSGLLSPPFLSKTAYNCLIQPLLPFGSGIRAVQKNLQNVKGLPSPISEFAKINLKKIYAYFFE